MNKKVIVRLLGSCLLCLPLTMVNCKGTLSDRFYDALTTYTSGKAGYKNSDYSEKKIHGYLSGKYPDCATTDAKYSQIKGYGKNTTDIIFDKKSFQIKQGTGGDYYNNADEVCPLWTNDGGGNDLSANNHDSIFVAGLECISPYAAGSSETLKSLTFYSVPVALDEHACENIKGLETVIFDGNLPYYMANNALPATVTTIKFFYPRLPELTKDNFKEKIQAFAKKNVPACRGTIKANLKDSSYWEWPENDNFSLFNYLKSHRYYTNYVAPDGTRYLSINSYLYKTYVDDRACLIWSRTPLDASLNDDYEEMYWGGSNSEIWLDGNTPILGSGISKSKPYMLSNEESVMDTPLGENTATDEKLNDNDSSNDTVQSSDTSSRKENNELGSYSSSSEINSASSPSSTSSSATDVNSSNTSSSHPSTASYSASVSTYDCSHIHPFLSLSSVISGSSLLILKKKKDD